MKRALLVIAIVVGCCAVVRAGLQLGLGSAVAGHDADQIDAERTRALTLNLPPCTETPYSVSPIDLGTTFNLDPLGHLAGVGGHMFPTGHIYFYVMKATAATPTTNIYAPAYIGIYQIASSRYLNANPPFTDYTVRFSPCQGLTGFFYHVNELSPALAATVGPIDEYCSTYPDGSIYYCTKTVATYLNAGDVVGTMTGRAGSSFYTLDFGSRDRTQAALPFISPARQNPEDLYTRCPLDRFEEPVKSQLEALLGMYDGSARRTDPPVCGEVMQDLPNTAQGLWYVPGTPQSPVQDIRPHLALVHDNVRTSTGAFSVGTSMAASSLSGGQYYFNTAGAGLVNLDFDLVTAGGTVYCYDSFSNLINGIILVQLTDSTTLKIERQTAASCGAGPWSFTGSASTFVR